MIEVVMLRFDSVIARVAPSLSRFLCELAGRELDIDQLLFDSHHVREDFESFLVERLRAEGVNTPETVANRISAALVRPEAWELFDDTRLGIEWMAQRRIPVSIVSRWAVDAGAVLRRYGIVNDAPGNAETLVQDAALSDVIWFECGRKRIGAEEVLYVAGDLSSDFEEARTAGCYTLVMDRDGQFDETIPNINHLVEIELHI